MVSKKERSYIQQKDEMDYLVNLIKGKLRACRLDLLNNNALGVFLNSPKGNGKTLMIHDISRCFNSKLFVNAGNQNTTRIDIEGYFTDDGDGNIYFNKGNLIKAIEYCNKTGLVFYLINELNMILPNEQAGFNELLDFQNQINLLAKSDKSYKIKPDSLFVFVGTMNLNTRGIMQLQQALHDRQDVVISLSYPEEDKEIEIIKKSTDCPEELATALVKSANLIRQSYENNKLNYNISPRTIVNFLDNFRTSGSNQNVRSSLMYSLIMKIANTSKGREIVMSHLESQDVISILNRHKDGYCYDFDSMEKKKLTIKEVKHDEHIERLGKTQIDVLCCLHEFNYHSSTNIAKHLNKAVSHMYQVLQKLTEYGYVSYEKENERKFKYYITDLGKKVVKLKGDI